MTASITIDVSRGPQWLRSQRIPLSGMITLGAAPVCDVILAGVAPQHAFLMPEGAGVRLIAGRGQSVRVGGISVRETLPLERGQIEIGPYRLALIVEPDLAPAPDGRARFEPPVLASSLDGSDPPGSDRLGLDAPGGVARTGLLDGNPSAADTTMAESGVDTTLTESRAPPQTLPPGRWPGMRCPYSGSMTIAGRLGSAVRTHRSRGC